VIQSSKTASCGAIDAKPVRRVLLQRYGLPNQILTKIFLTWTSSWNHDSYYF